MLTERTERFVVPPGQTSNFGFAVWEALPRCMTEFHRHNDVEINLLLAGEMVYLHGGNLVRVKAGELVVFWAARPHQVITVSDDAFFSGLTVPLSWFLGWRLNRQLVSEVLHGRFLRPPLTEPLLDFPELVRQWIPDMEDHYERRMSLIQLETEAWFRRLELAMEEADPEHQLEHEAAFADDLAKVALMVRFVNENYTDCVSTADIAAAAGLDAEQAPHFFHQKTGFALAEFITEQRLAHAQLLLATTGTNVLDVAMDSGFGSSSRFYDVFREALGVSPKEFRDLMRPTSTTLDGEGAEGNA